MATVKDFTDDVTEIKLGSEGPYIITLRDLLSKAGIDVYNKYPTDDYSIFDEGLEQAVMDFQKDNGFMESEINGIVNDMTLNSILAVSGELSDIIYSEVAESTIAGIFDTNDVINPHFDSCFSNTNSKNTRKNNQDIIIILGDNSVVKTIHNVYMRGVSTEYDTSGNPISEVYEFIAQDITESDEYKDKTKYE